MQHRRSQALVLRESKKLHKASSERVLGMEMGGGFLQHLCSFGFVFEGYSNKRIVLKPFWKVTDQESV